MEKNEVAIIGLGPAGIAAAIYLKRYGFNPIVIGKESVSLKTNRLKRWLNFSALSC